MATSQNIPPVPYDTPITGSSGLITLPWQAWFRQIFNRVGGSIAPAALINPMTSLGDTMFGGVSGSVSRLPGNISTTKKFLVEVGNGTISSDPVWGPIDGDDLADIDIDTMSSGSATLGQVPTADGLGAITWATPGGLAVLGTRATPIAITAAGGVTSTINRRQLIRVAGSGGAITITANPAISVGTFDGQELILEGSNVSNTLTINNGNGIEASSVGAVTLGQGDKVAYLWNAAASVWTEQYRINMGVVAQDLTDDAGNPLTDDAGNPLTS